MHTELHQAVWAGCTDHWALMTVWRRQAQSRLQITTVITGSHNLFELKLEITDSKA